VLTLCEVLTGIFALGGVPMVYLRPNLNTYDATYLTENDIRLKPFMRDWDGMDCGDNTVYVPVVW